MDHAYWTAYLAQGLRKAKTVSRPINKHQNQRVVRLSNGDIGLRLHYTYCVIFHVDGTVTIDTGGWNTITTRAFINEHAPVDLWQVSGDLFLGVPNPTFSEPRVRKCRKCRGKTVLPDSCHGPNWCYPPWYDGSQPCEHGQTVAHKREQCWHGKTGSHALPDVECWRCKGSGSVDYGSKPIHFAWSGTAYRFDPCDVQAGLYTWPDTTEAPDVPIGKPSNGPWQSQPYVPPAPKYVAPAPVSDYSRSGDILAGLIPSILQVARYPCSCDLYGYERGVNQIIVHLNDGCKWTREAIADWLETLDLDLRFPTPVA